MSISYQAKSSPVLGRQLEVQEIQSVCDLSATPAKSDAPSIVSVDATIEAAVVISILIGESLREAPVAGQPEVASGGKVFTAQVINRATGSNLALTGVPTISADKQSILVTADCTGADSVCVKVCYKVAE
jgi:hypothetical protein